MKRELRQRLAVMLMGVAAALVALTVVSLLQARACAAVEGRWIAAARHCELPLRGAPSDRWAWLLGALAGALTLVVLWRTWTFFATRAARRGTLAP